MGWQIIHLICISEKQKYFFKADWTGQISLIRHDKSDFTRTSWKRWNDNGGRPRLPAARAAFVDAADGKCVTAPGARTTEPTQHLRRARKKQCQQHFRKYKIISSHGIPDPRRHQAIAQTQVGQVRLSAVAGVDPCPLSGRLRGLSAESTRPNQLGHSSYPPLEGEDK